MALRLWCGQSAHQDPSRTSFCTGHLPSVLELSVTMLRLSDKLTTHQFGLRRNTTEYLRTVVAHVGLYSATLLVYL